MQGSKVAKVISFILWRGILSLMAIAVTSFLAVQAGLIVGWLWLQSGSGQRWIEAQIETALKDTGYHLTFKSIAYRPFTTLVARDVKVTDDKGGLIAGVDRLSLHAGFASLLNHQLRLQADIGTVMLGTAKGDSAGKETTPTEPFALPDIYIKSVIVEKLIVRKIVSDDETLVQNLSLKGNADLGSLVAVTLQAETGDDNPDYLPDELEAEAVFDPATLLLGVQELKVSSELYKLAASGSANLGEKGGILVQANGTVPDLSKLSSGFAGTATITAELSGTMDKPKADATMKFSLKSDSLKDVKDPVVTLKATDLADAPHLVLKAVSAYQGKAVSVQTVIDIKENAVTLKDLSVKAPGITMSGSVTADTAKATANGKLRLSLRDLSPYAPDVPPYNLPQGNVDIVFSPASGNGYAFRAASSIRLNKSQLNINGRMGIDAAFKRLSINSLQIRDSANGRVTVDGYYGLSDAVARLHAVINRFAIPAIDDVDGQISGDLVFAQNGDDYSLEGNLKPNQMEITIPEHMTSSIPALNVIRPGKQSVSAPAFLEHVAVKISVAAKNRIFVRGWGLDAELGGNVDITGHLDNPQLNGQFSTLKGRYEEFGKRFTIDHAIMRFQGSVPPSPYLDVKAVTQADDIEAAILITGPVTKPEIGFSSTPALPKDEVLARILFGRDVRGLSPFEAIQLADTLRRLSGEGGSGFNPVQSFRQAIGLDDLRVDQDSSGGTTVGAGKYISEKVYLEVKKGQGDNTGGANIQIDLTKHTKLESEVGQESSGAGLSWRWDY